MGDLHRLIAFDLDGTLVDSRRDLADSVNELLHELGAVPLPTDEIAAMVGEGAATLVRRALTAAGFKHVPDALPRYLAIYDTRLLNHTRAYEGVADALHVARRHARLAVLTNKPTRPTERILAGLGLRELFGEVVGGDGPFPRKPDPTSLFALMDRTRASRRHTLLVGDSAIDHETATRAGVRCCLVSWGFGNVAFPAERLTGGQWLVKEPQGLIDVITRFAGDRATDAG